MSFFITRSVTRLVEWPEWLLPPLSSVVSVIYVVVWQFQIQEVRYSWSAGCGHKDADVSRGCWPRSVGCGSKHHSAARGAATTRCRILLLCSWSWSRTRVLVARLSTGPRWFV